MFLQKASRVLEEKRDVKLANYLRQETINLFERAIDGLMKESKLLYFANADFEGERRKFDHVREYTKLLRIENINPTLTYVQFMIFVRRTEGANNALKVFKRAREDKRTGHQIIVAAALMEYYCRKDEGVAMNVFSLGLKKQLPSLTYGKSDDNSIGPMLEQNIKKDFYQLLTTNSDPSAVVRSSDLADLKRKRGDSDDEDDNGHGQATIGSLGTRDAYKRRMNNKNE